MVSAQAATAAQAAMTVAVDQRRERVHALDATRAIVMLLGVVLHVAWAYLPGIGPHWPLADRSSSVALGLVFYVIHMFRMMAFYLIAGFFARALLQRYGMAGWLRNRFRRVVVPLVLAYLTLVPIMTLAVAWSMVRSGRAGSASPIGLLLAQDGLPPFHLWFLYYLLLIYAAAVPARWLFARVVDAGGQRRVRIDRAIAGILRSPWAPLVAGIPCAVGLLLSQGWDIWLGIRTPDQSLVPEAPALGVFGLAFAFGWVLQRQPVVLNHLAQRWRGHLAVAMVATIASLALFGVVPTYRPVPAGLGTLAFAVIYATAAWGWIFALIGGAVAHFGQSRASWRYLADASYFVYLVHLPLVLWLQAALRDVAWHWSIKFSIILVITLAALMLTYHYGVRRKTAVAA
jgi:glucans biosynthesis protein C